MLNNNELKQCSYVGNSAIFIIVFTSTYGYSVRLYKAYFWSCHIDDGVKCKKLKRSQRQLCFLLPSVAIAFLWKWDNKDTKKWRKYSILSLLANRNII